MSKDIYDKLKILSDIVKDNKWLFLILISSIGGNIGQAIYGNMKIEEKAQEIKAVKKQVTNVAESYSKYIPKETIIIQEPRKKIIIKESSDGCEVCKKELDKLDKKYKKHIEHFHN